MGYGIIKFADGATYEGEFRNNMLHGKGKYVWKDGKMYDGE